MLGPRPVLVSHRGVQLPVESVLHGVEVQGGHLRLSRPRALRPQLAGRGLGAARRRVNAGHDTLEAAAGLQQVRGHRERGDARDHRQHLARVCGVCQAEAKELDRCVLRAAPRAEAGDERAVGQPELAPPEVHLPHEAPDPLRRQLSVTSQAVVHVSDADCHAGLAPGIRGHLVSLAGGPELRSPAHDGQKQAGAHGLVLALGLGLRLLSVGLRLLDSRVDLEDSRRPAAPASALHASLVATLVPLPDTLPAALFLLHRLCPLPELLTARHLTFAARQPPPLCEVLLELRPGRGTLPERGGRRCGHGGRRGGKGGSGGGGHVALHAATHVATFATTLKHTSGARALQGSRDSSLFAVLRGVKLPAGNAVVIVTRPAAKHLCARGERPVAVVADKFMRRVEDVQLVAAGAQVPATYTRRRRAGRPRNSVHGDLQVDEPVLHVLIPALLLLNCLVARLQPEEGLLYLLARLRGQGDGAELAARGVAEEEPRGARPLRRPTQVA
mmetsp:Transcript_31562/g.90613  ORF Transcript_31562/g.90613 Transcript_31562/m.90613 type:complete len:501 (+) Transcript_31562:727-2229(+)